MQDTTCSSDLQKDADVAGPVGPQSERSAAGLLSSLGKSSLCQGPWLCWMWRLREEQSLQRTSEDCPDGAERWRLDLVASMQLLQKCTHEKKASKVVSHTHITSHHTFKHKSVFMASVSQFDQLEFLLFTDRITQHRISSVNDGLSITLMSLGLPPANKTDSWRLPPANKSSHLQI